MNKQAINIVWLKRDLRTRNHLPLHMADEAGLPYLILYLYEPELLKRPDSSLRHLQFIHHSIRDMNRSLAKSGHEVAEMYGDADEIFQFFIDSYEVHTIWSYQESGPQQTWERDKRVAALLHKNSIEWIEFQRDGVVRGIKSRDGWDKQWFSTMHKSMVDNHFTRYETPCLNHPFVLPDKFIGDLEDYSQSMQPAGETHALDCLNTFLAERGKNYSKNISKPAASQVSCSRLSAYLAWGNISIQQVYQLTRGHENYQINKRAYSAFLARIKWHCHFIQKFEVESSYETVCLNRGYETLEHDNNNHYLKAWMQGQTGFPMVDACMRCLIETGWINFRMRAMLVSFLCHHLDQDWRRGTHHLAGLFLDYEPGIHYTQFQMQAGTTGINTVRIYNPVKQSIEHDPEAVFLKKWIPELKGLPLEFIHEPWKMSDMEQLLYGVELGVDYPFPVVRHMESGKKAKSKIWGHRKNNLVKQEKKRILATHVRTA